MASVLFELFSVGLVLKILSLIVLWLVKTDLMLYFLVILSIFSDNFGKHIIKVGGYCGCSSNLVLSSWEGVIACLWHVLITFWGK